MLRNESRNKYSFVKISKSSLFLSCLFLMLLLPACPKAVQCAAPDFKVEVYSIKTIPFEKYEVVSDGDNAAIIFTEYGSEAKLLYPLPKERIPENIQHIVQKCMESLKANVDRIVEEQKGRPALKNYLSAQNSVPLFSKEDYMDLVKEPQGQAEAIQADPGTGRINAEFCAKGVAIDENTSFAICLTFIFNPKEDRIEKIVISGIKLIAVK